MANPYVGPRPLAEGDLFFGRDREVSELRYLLGSERIVLFYAPSGAGKSSLVNAKLVPEMRRRFDVWSATRVTSPPSVVDAPNKYVWSAISGLEKQVPPHFERKNEDLARQTLKQYFDARPRRPDAPANVLLIFDQFEEIVRVDPVNLQPKHEFFSQLGELLMEPTVWALFILREDFLAPLDPYIAQVPTRFKNRYRMDLLSVAQARDAIANPAALCGREFIPDAVARLIADLATVQVQRPDGHFESDIGAYVEPMHLQIVCRTLWDRLPPSQTSITLGDVQNFGEVTKVLAAYYAAQVAKVAAGNTGVERAIRRWVETRLIIAGAVRNQVMRTAESSEGLANHLIDSLVDSHLLREEQRVNARWYELAHDRLIRPVKVDNEVWFERNLTKAQRMAEVWSKEGEPAGLLLAGADLETALAWKKTQAGQLTKEETRFLDESVAAGQASARERQQRHRIRTLAIVSTVGGVLAFVLFLVAVYVAIYARKQEHQALSLELAARSQYQSANKTLSVLLALYALEEACTREAREALLAAVTNARTPWLVRGLAAIAVAPGSGQMASAGADGALRVWDINSGRELASAQAPVPLQEGPLASRRFNGVCFLSPQKIAATLSDGSVGLFTPSGQRLSVSQPTGDDAGAVACSPKGNQIAVATFVSRVPAPSLLDAATHIREIFLPNTVSVAFNPAGNLIAAGGTDGSVTVYAAESSAMVGQFHGFRRPVTALAFSPDGTLLAAAGLEDALVLLHTPDWRPTQAKAVGLGGVLGLAFSPDGSTMALAGVDGSGLLVRVPGLGERLILPKAGNQMLSVSFLRAGDGRLLAGSRDSHVYLYDLNTQRLARSALALPGQPTQLSDRQCRAFVGNSTCEPVHLPLRCEDR